ncbi:hypothetical protein C4J97_2594 [Pseudomonas orientalis]|nr:hypothetical protein C4J97_2594 [Pseudomonas orientalis]
MYLIRRCRTIADFDDVQEFVEGVEADGFAKADNDVLALGVLTKNQQ